MLKEDVNRLAGNLQCFIDLSLFDGNTGETFSKDRLDKDSRKQVTACEKALALVLGEKDTVDEMSFAECAEVLKGLQKEFSAHVSELKAFEEKDTPLIVMEEGQAEAFGEAAKLCEAYQMDEVMHNSSEKRVAIIDNEFKKIAPDKFRTLDFTDSEIMRFNYEDSWNLKAILSYEKSKELVDSVYKGYLSKLASWLDVTEMTTDISLRNDGRVVVNVGAEQFISSDKINTAYVESYDLKGEKGDIVRDKMMSRAREKGYDISELDKPTNDKSFSADDLIDILSSTSLELFVYGDYLYVYDSYHEGEKEYDYGIYDRIPLEEAEKNGISIDNIPNIYVDGYVSFLLDDELPYNHHINANVVSKMSDTNYDKWSDILKENGYNGVANDLGTSFKILKGEHSSPVTKEDYPVLKDNRIIKAIEKVYGSDKKKDDVERE